MLHLLLGVGIGGLLFTNKGKEIANDLVNKTYDSIRTQLKEFTVFEDKGKKKNVKISQNDNNYPKSIKNENNV